ncbi:hypothetical protein [Pseudoxanthomonas wuyuanensis]
MGDRCSETTTNGKITLHRFLEAATRNPLCGIEEAALHLPKNDSEIHFNALRGQLSADLVSLF